LLNVFNKKSKGFVNTFFHKGYKPPQLFQLSDWNHGKLLPTRESLSILDSSRSLRGLYKRHFLSKNIVKFWLHRCSRSLNKSRIFKLENFSDPDPD